MKQGKVFSLFLLLTYIGAAIFALVLVSSNFNDMPDQGIGAYQAGTLAAYDRAFQKLHYLEDAARLSIDNAAEELYDDPALFFTIVEGDATEELECGSYGYLLWDCDMESRLHTTFSTVILQHLTGHTGKYPPGGFSVDYAIAPGETTTSFSAPKLEEPILINLPYLTTANSVEQALEPPGGYLSWPSSGSQMITSCYGPRPGVAAAKSDTHAGMDIGAGGEVLAAADGVVMNNAKATDYGTLWIKHSDTLSTAYLHLDKATVTLKEGDVVKRGQVLGEPSDTGCAADGCGKHLHFEVLVKPAPGTPAYERSFAPGWKAINPICFFDGLTANRIAGSTQHSCKHPDYPKPALTAYCENYDLKLEDASTYQPGTRIGNEDGNITTTEEPAVGDDGLRPSNLGLTQGQQAKFATTEQNRVALGWDKYVVAASAEYGIEQALLLGIVTQESLGKPDAISPTGCLGLMQLCYATAEGSPYYDKGSLTSCGYSCVKNNNCRCNPENDKRFDAEKNALAGAYTLDRKLAQFKGKRAQLEFGVASYNVGEGVIHSAIRGVGGSDPTWGEVIAYLEHHPELVTYFSSKVDQVKKVEEVKGYVPAVLAYAAAWKGAPIVAPTLPGTFGDVKNVGRYRFDPSMTIAHPDYLTPFTDLIHESTRLIDICSREKDPGECLQREAAANEWNDCEEGPSAYFLSLYEALRDCAENKQYACQCSLPIPGEGVGTLLVNAAQRNAEFDGSHLLLENISEKTIRVAGVVPAVLELSLNRSVMLAYEEAVPTGTVADRFVWEAGWVVEKDGEHLSFKASASGVEQCASVKTKYTYCATPVDGLPPVKFALEVQDTLPPTPPLGLAFDGVNVVFSPSFSEDVAFYNVYDAQPPGSLPVLQTADHSFPAATYLGRTLYVTAVDRAGNEGADANVIIA